MSNHTVKSNKGMAVALSDAGVRVEQIIYLAAEIATNGEPSVAFLEALGYGSDQFVEVLFPHLKKTVEDEDDDSAIDTGLDPDLDDMWEVLERLASDGRFGFMVQLARPVPHDFTKDGRRWDQSWGCYQTSWFYVNDLLEIAAIAEEWSKEIVNSAAVAAGKEPPL